MGFRIWGLGFRVFGGFRLHIRVQLRYDVRGWFGYKLGVDTGSVGSRGCVVGIAKPLNK